LGTQLANLSNAKLELLYALETTVEHSEDQYTLIHQKQQMANLQANVYEVPGAHEPPKVAKEHATYAACQVPSQSKFIEINHQLLISPHYRNRIRKNPKTFENA